MSGGGGGEGGEEIGLEVGNKSCCIFKSWNYELGIFKGLPLQKPSVFRTGPLRDKTE